VVRGRLEGIRRGGVGRARAGRAVGRAAAARLPRGAAGAERVAAVPLPLSLFPSRRAARRSMRKIPEKEKGGGRGSLCGARGGDGFLSLVQSSEGLEREARPACS
jgi:hypothetical protein